MVSHKLDLFGVHESSSSGVKMYLICHVISKGHVIEGLCKFMGGSSLGYTAILTSFVTKGIRYNASNLSHDLMWFHV